MSHKPEPKTALGCVLMPFFFGMLVSGVVGIYHALRLGIMWEFWWIVWYFLIPLLLAVSGLAGLTSRSWMRQSHPEAGNRPSQSMSSAGSLFPSVADSGPVVLAPERTRFESFVLILIFAILWNGSLYLCISDFYQGWQAGEPEWELVIGFIILAPIGLLMPVLVVHAFWKLFIPRPILKLSRSEIPLGEVAELSWRFAGRSSLIRHLKIAILCEEQATYGRGTDTETDESSLLKQTLLDTRLKSEIHAGSVTVAIPYDGMHTLNAEHNKVVWFLVVDGVIDNRPDVCSRYPFSVPPHAPRSAL